MGYFALCPQEVISLVRAHGLVLDSQAGRSVGYRQALVYLRDVWGFPSAGPERKCYSPQVSQAAASLA